MDSFVPLKFLSLLVLPPGSVASGVLVGILLMIARRRRTGNAIAILAVLQGIAVSFPPVSDALIAPLERRAGDAAQLTKPCCYSAIVLLGGGVLPAMPPSIRKSHLLEGADRIVHAAELFHNGVAPRVIVSGGREPVDGASESEADAMEALLVRLGVPKEAIVKEDQSRNTLDNIAFVHRLVGNEPVALVTSAYHMPRALKIAQRDGVDASAFPTDWNVPWDARPNWENWLPTIGAERASFLALREFLALVFDRRQADSPGANRPQ